MNDNTPSQPENMSAPTEDKPPRWIAQINYRFDNGIRGVLIGFEEFGDLGEVIEQGPHWDSVVSINVERLRDADETMTVEKASSL
jgi:hypothetical protein